MGYLLPPMNASLPTLWLSDPAWMAMDPTCRGLHAQLVLVAAKRKPAGCLPDDDLRLRKWLSLPLPSSSRKVRKRASAGPLTLAGLVDAQLEGREPGQDLDRDHILDWLWNEHWKPAIFEAWQKIDDALVESRPELASQKGGWFSPLAKAIASGVADQPAAPAKTARRTRGATPKAAAQLPWPKGVGAFGEAANEGLEVSGFSSSPLLDSGQVLPRWREEVDQAARKTMWDVGVDCLAGVKASPAEKSKARGILGKYIKQYGEAAVAKGISTLAMRSIPPADAIAFLQGVLRQETEGGSEAEQKARSKRATVCL